VIEKFLSALAPCLVCTYLAIAAATAGAVNNSTAVEANHLLQRRCMVCHGCYDAPCQLKLEAHEGLTRGASKSLVYDSSRLLSGQLTRLFDDGLNEQQWRDKGFYPVLDNRRPRRGVMHRMLELKQENPLPTKGALPKGFDFSLYRDQQCPKPEEFDKFEQKYPLWGMPYGLPGLNPEQHKTMIDWIKQGAPELAEIPLSRSTKQAHARWEEFLNGSTNKQKLMSRYLYEHLFLADIYFENNGKPVWFRMIRSYTKPGRNIGLIATRRPYDDPRTGEFYYRLQRMPITALSKRHMPYLLDEKRMEFYRGLFLSPDYEVKRLPGYSSEVASNPFKSFEQIPVKSRYAFLLQEAQFSIMNFIKGAVCRGQIALNVIDERFWVMFVSPDMIDPELDAGFLANQSDNLRLPSNATSTVVNLFSWRKYARSQARYKAAKELYLQKELTREERNIGIESIWTGDGANDNAALTIFRHFDTASVVKGFVGDIPKTAWIIGYSLMERIHYLLVAGYDVYGAASHQLESRLYMDFLRMDGEFNFLMYMPPEKRVELRDHWYRNARRTSKEAFFGDSGIVDQPSPIAYKTDDPKREFLSTMRKRIHGAKAHNYGYRQSASKKMIEAFSKLEETAGKHNSFMPHVSFVNVIGSNRDEAYTIIRNTGYSNIAQLFQEAKRTLPEEDTLTVVRGFIGAYPNYFFQVPENQIAAFAADIANMTERKNYDALVERYGVHRNATWFWRVSDKFHEMLREQDPIAAGLLDYNRYHSH